MLSVKESLRTTVDSISEEEALRVLSFIEQNEKASCAVFDLEAAGG